MSFSVSIEPSGREFLTHKGETLLSAALLAGVALPYGCKDGACGSCKCKLLSGEVTHNTHQSKALSEQEEREGHILTCCAVAHSDVVLHCRQVLDVNLPLARKMPVRVDRLQSLAPDVMQVFLQLPQNDAFDFLPGQYVDFLLKDGLRRSYSMANGPFMKSKNSDSSESTDPLAQAITKRFIELHIRHMPGGMFTDHVFSDLKIKDILRIEGPLGGFFLHASDKPIIFLASGTGFAPIKSMLESIALSQDMNLKARRLHLFWGARDLPDLYQQEWVLEIQKKLPQLTYTPVLSEPSQASQWRGREGFVHLAVLEDYPDLSTHQVYACGAPIVVESAKRDFVQKAQLPVDEFFADSFLSQKDKAQDSSFT
jgi:CDP-4-dehydro-6-deoxyglucose reductase, E3